MGQDEILWTQRKVEQELSKLGANIATATASLQTMQTALADAQELLKQSQIRIEAIYLSLHLAHDE